MTRKILERTHRLRQSGMTLIELLVSITISMVAVAGMMLLTASTLGSATDSIENARLSGELRAALQIMTRDLRRANFNDGALSCIANGQAVCAAVTDTVTVNSGCLAYSYTRNGTTFNGAFRLNSGALQMRTDAAVCGNSANWENLTDEGVITVTAFTVTDTDGSDLSYLQSVTSTINQRVRKVRLNLTGQICRQTDGEGGCSEYAERQFSSVIRVRNDVRVAVAST